MGGSSLVIALLAVPIWAGTNAAMQVGVAVLHGHPVVLSCASLGIGGAMLLAVSGLSPTARAALRSPWSWAFGALRLLNSILLVATLAHLGAASVMALQRTSVIVAMLAAAAASGGFARLPLLPAAGMATAALMLAASVPGGFANPGLSLILLSIVIEATIARMAERHPVGRSVRGLRERAGYTGAMLAISAGLLLAFVALVAALVAGFDLRPPVLVATWLPNVAALTDTRLLLYAAVVALVIRVPGMAAYLRVAPDLGATRLLAVESLAVPLLFLAMPLLARAMPLPGAAASWAEIAAGLAITACSLRIAFARRR